MIFGSFSFYSAQTIRLVQVQNAQDAGFQAVIVFDNLDESLVDMGGSGGLLKLIAFSIYTQLMNLM